MRATKINLWWLQALESMPGEWTNTQLAKKLMMPEKSTNKAVNRYTDAGFLDCEVCITTNAIGSKRLVRYFSFTDSGRAMLGQLKRHFDGDIEALKPTRLKRPASSVFDYAFSI